VNVLAAMVLLAAVQTAAGGADLRSAIARFQAGDCSGVVAILSPEETPDPAQGDVPYAMLAACYLQLGRLAEGMKVARTGLMAVPQSGVLKRMLGQQLFRENPYSPEAGALLEGAILALPQDPESRHYFAQWAYMNNRDADCVRREREALLSPGLNPTALLQMNTLIGMCEARSGDPDAARAAFEVAWAINKRLPRLDAASAYRYVRFLSDDAGTDQLKAVLDEVLDRAPRHGPVLVERAKLLRREGRAQEAIDAAHLALGGDGNDIASMREAHVVLARSYFMLGQLEKAADEQEWVDRHPVAPTR
jgi:tetratricopeptide (TPR) repeat protein